LKPRYRAASPIDPPAAHWTSVAIAVLDETAEQPDDAVGAAEQVFRHVVGGEHAIDGDAVALGSVSSMWPISGAQCLPGGSLSGLSKSAMEPGRACPASPM